MKTFKQLTLMAAILLGIQGLGASIHEEDDGDKSKTPPAAEGGVAASDESTKPSGDDGKNPDAPASKKRLCEIL